MNAEYKGEAAVLVPVFEHAGEPHFLLTKRSEEVQTHKGHISFPGGMRHEGEDLQATALRETHEEIGVQASRIEILGRFHDYLSSTDCRVSPFVGYLDEPFKTTPQIREVAEILRVPFSLFSDPTRLRVSPVLRRGLWMDIYFYSYGADEIWGLTARIIREFLEELQRGG